jgi:hypothetical protein
VDGERGVGRSKRPSDLAISRSRSSARVAMPCPWKDRTIQPVSWIDSPLQVADQMPIVPAGGIALELLDEPEVILGVGDQLQTGGLSGCGRAWTPRRP